MELGEVREPIEQQPLQSISSQRFVRQVTPRRLLGSLLVLGGSTCFVLVLWRLMHRDFPQPNANDLWAIHDLLLVGYAAPFMRQGTKGQRDVQDAAVELAQMLPLLHPHPPCRERIEVALAAGYGRRAGLIAAAETSWGCLPASFSSRSFIHPFLPEAIDNPWKAYVAGNPLLKDPHLLSACRGSGWPRACSFWVSLHAMAYQADALNIGSRFMRITVAILGGGALQCGGCTIHFQLLHKFVLAPGLVKDFGGTY